MNERNNKKIIELGEILTKVFPYNIINNDGCECIEEIINECLKAPEIIDFKNKNFSETIIFSQIWDLLCASPDDEKIVECYKEYLESKNYKVFSMDQLKDELAKHTRIEILLSGKNSNINLSSPYFYEEKNSGYMSFDVWKVNDKFCDNNDFRMFYLKKIFKEDFTKAGYILDDFIKDIKDCIKKEILKF